MDTTNDNGGDASTLATVGRLQASLEATSRSGELFARTLTTAFADIALKGQDLGTISSNLAERLAGLAAKTAESPIQSGFGQMFSGLLGGGAYGIPDQEAATGAAASVILNVSTPDAESFTRSETQVAAMIARAAALGQRNM